MHLLAGEFSRLEFTSENDRAAGGIYFGGVVESGGRRQEEELLQHLDDVVVSMVIVVQEYYVEKLGMFLANLAGTINIDVWGNNRGGHSDEFNLCKNT